MDNSQLEFTEKLIQSELNIEQKENFKNFEKLFKFYNSHTNLISKNDEKFLFEKHIYDSLALSLFIKKYKTKPDAKLMDIGTGGGFPSIPLSIIFSDMQVTAIDSIAKKIGFLELVKKELRLDNLTPICARVEDLDKSYKNSYEIVTSRAVAQLNTLLEYAMPFVKNSKYFVAYKSVIADEELVNAQNALHKLNTEIIDRINYDLPNIDSHKRELLVFKKEKAILDIYPRKSGLAKKNPL